MVLPVFLAFDDKFVQHACVTAFSIIKNRAISDSIDFYFLVNDLKQDNIIKLKGFFSHFPNVNISFLDMSEYFVSSQELKKISRVMYYRLMIAELFPQLDKAIYLDCDIVVNGSLAEFYDLDIDNYYLAAVQSPGSRIERFVTDKNNQQINYYEYLKNLGMEQDIIESHYINSGVLLLNTKRIRTSNLLSHMLSIIDSGDYLYAPDQDVINVVSQKEKLILPLTWNFQTSLLFSVKDRSLSRWYENNTTYYSDLFYYKKNKKLPSIIHFVYNKPWEPLEKKSKYNHLYWNYLKFTPWANERYSYFLKCFCVLDKIISIRCKSVIKSILQMFRLTRG